MGDAWKFLLLTVALFAAGCAADGDSSRDGISPASDGTTSGAAVDTVLVERSWKLGGGEEFDVLCAMGGGFELKREEGALIDAAATKLVFVVAGGDANTGIQPGYAVDGNEPTWLEVARLEDFRAEVPVDAGQHESTEPRWQFYFRQSVAGTSQECYTGASFEHAVTITARHG